MTLYRYILGYTLSLALTVAGPLLLWLHEALHHQLPTHPELIAAFVAFALCQLAVQLIFFMHLGQGKKVETVVFAFTLVIVFILVGGTLWIMHNLQSQHAMPELFEHDIIAPQYQLE